MVAQELGIGKSTLSSRTKRYREEGEAGLEYRYPVPNAPKRINPAIKAKAVELKKEDPKRGNRPRSVRQNFCPAHRGHTNPAGW